MARKAILILVGSAAICAGLASTASAASPIRLYLNEGAAFSILGHSCGGIQQQVYARGFASNGYPTGNVSMSTTCGGSGKGGGGGHTTYTGTASVVWTWFGETRSYGSLQGALEGVSAEDGHGDRVYDVGSAAYLENGNPPLQSPAAPTEVSASVGLYEQGESELLRMAVGWVVAPETAALIKSSTITATPVNSSAPVLSTTVSSYWSSGFLQPVQPNTTYNVTVTNTDSEGTSQPSSAVTVKSPNEDGEAEKEHNNVETCEQSTGTIKLKPGLTETPRTQSITVKGELKGCNGPLDLESGSYVDHLKTTEEVTCATLASSSLEPTTTTASLSVKWVPTEAGNSTGSLVLPISEVSLTGLSGMFEGGPFSTPTSVSAASVYETFTGGPTCGQAVGKKKAKPVKSGSFSTGEIEFG
jgi:hypothetical protein